jgi:TRAP-type transport system periplasmic protein
MNVDTSVEGDRLPSLQVRDTMKLARRQFLALSTTAIFAPMVKFACSQPAVLRLQHHEPAQGTVPRNFVQLWANKIESESCGQIKIELHPSMQLGGTPGQNYDLARDGVVDLAWTLPGYTPGRFPRSEVIELPFMGSVADKNSSAAWELYEKHLKDDYKDVKVLALHTNGPCLIHAKGTGIRRLEDVKGLKMCGTSRPINKLLEALGATPVYMPTTAVADALSKGIIDAAVASWEVTGASRIAELTGTHTAACGRRSLCVSLFTLVMNKRRYDSLRPELKKVIDNNSGLQASKWAGKVMARAAWGPQPQPFTSNGTSTNRGQALANRGNTVIALDAAEMARWRKACEPVIDEWQIEVTGKGINGQQLVADTRGLIEKHAGSAT